MPYTIGDKSPIQDPPADTKGRFRALWCQNWSTRQLSASPINKGALNRLKEPSSMAGLAVLLGLFGVPAAPEIVQGAGQVLAGVLGLAAVVMREKGAK